MATLSSTNLHSSPATQPLVDTTRQVPDVTAHNRMLQPHILHLLQSSHRLRLPVETTFAGAVLLHRLALVQENITKWDVVVCLLLACKREEEPRRLRDFINCLETPVVLLDLGDEAYWKAKQQLVRHEQVVLRWLAFDVTVSRPYRAIVIFVQRACAGIAHESVDMALVQAAFCRVSDCLFAIQALQQPADLLAIAALWSALLQPSNEITVAYDTTRETLLGTQFWKEQFGISVDSDRITTLQKTMAQASQSVKSSAVVPT